MDSQKSSKSLSKTPRRKSSISSNELKSKSSAKANSSEKTRNPVKKISYKSSSRTKRHSKLDKTTANLPNSEMINMQDIEREQNTSISTTKSHEKEIQKPIAMTKKSNLVRSKSEAYLRNKVKTASGGELVLMLYEKAISNLTIACNLLEQPSSNPSVQMGIGSNVRNAQEIILELLYSLDIETGGEFARKMSSIYSFMNRELSEAIIEKSEVRIKPILEQLKILLEAWRKAHEQLKTQEQLSRPNSEGIQLGS